MKGSMPVYLRITGDGIPKEISTGRQCDPDKWNSNAGRVSEHFMLELGKGFFFEGRQKRFTFDGDNFYVDLLFYNRLLKCYVLIDLKIGRLSHQDIGQMQMYINFYDRKMKYDMQSYWRSLIAPCFVNHIFCYVALKEIITMTEKILTDNKYLLDDRQNFRFLLSILDHFANSGWQEAFELTWRLKEIF